MSNWHLSHKVEEIPPSGIRTFFDLVFNMKNVISLGVGEPDFASPWHIRETAIFALEQGYTSYTSNKGMIELRKEISAFLRRRYGLWYDPEKEILITVGVSEAVDLAMRAIINPGDHFLIHQPSYVSYGPMVSLAGGRPVFVQTPKENGFKLTPQQIEKACKKQKIKGILINYPCNPTGASYSRGELKEIARVAQKYNLIVISDEVYDELSYDFDHVPLGTITGMKKNLIYLNGFSKAYAMTGFRIGYACGPKKVIAAMTKIHQYTMLCASIISQMAAIEALRRGAKVVAEMKREYNRRRRYIVQGLNEIGLDCHMPEGAFYVFPSIEKTSMDSLSFAKRLLQKKRVAVVPGMAFGEGLEKFIRISYASSYENIKEALVRMKEFLVEEKQIQ